MRKITAEELFVYVREQNSDVEIYGDPKVEINGFSSLQYYKQGSITWVKGQANVRSGMEKLKAVVCSAGCRDRVRGKAGDESSQRYLLYGSDISG